MVVGLGFILYTPFMDYIYIPYKLGKEQNQVVEMKKEDFKNNLLENKDDLELFDFGDVSSIDINELKKAKLDKSKVIGVVYVPSVGIKMPIMYGATHKNMLVGTGTLKPNQEMGKGNYSIASHNHPNKNMLFAPIRRIESGQKMYITDLDNVYIYSMVEKEVIEPSRVDVIEDKEGKEELTLVSCYSSDGSDRIYVTGELDEVVKFEDMPYSFQLDILE